MNTKLKGKEFERESFEYLKNQFDKVEWLSEKQLSTFDFKVSKDNKEFYVEAKYLTIRNKNNSKVHLSENQKEADFVITNSKKGIVLIPKKDFIRHIKIVKNSYYIVISPYFKLWLKIKSKEKETYEETILRLIGLKKE